MKINIASDHAGVEFKEFIKKHISASNKNIEVIDMGSYNSDSVDYPDYAKKLSLSVAAKEADLGILICGTGIGMCIAANKVKGIRAALAYNSFTAKMSKLHNNANVLCLGSRVLGSELAFEIIDEWLNTKFAGGRHQKRIDKISSIENGGN